MKNILWMDSRLNRGWGKSNCRAEIRLNVAGKNTEYHVRLVGDESKHPWKWQAWKKDERIDENVLNSQEDAKLVCLEHYIDELIGMLQVLGHAV